MRPFLSAWKHTEAVLEREGALKERLDVAGLWPDRFLGAAPAGA